MAQFRFAVTRITLRRALHITGGCRVEVFMKDNYTIDHVPWRVIRWVQLAREEAENLGVVC